MKTLNVFLATSALALSIAGSANAAGFAVQETSSTQLGNAFAGAGAQTSDVSGVWNNPAIAAFMAPGWHAAAQVSVIIPKSQFEDSTTTPTVGSAGPNADGGKTALVPSLYGLWAINDNFRAGLAVTAPFGLATEYPSDWIGRFKAVKSSLKTININPFISVKIHEKVSLGFGASFQYADIELTSKVANGFGLLPNLGEADFRACGSDWGYGFNAGIFINDLWEGSKIGIHYRSSINHNLRGERTVSGLSTNTLPGFPALTPLQIGALNGAAAAFNLANDTIGINACLRTPESVAFFFSQDFNEAFTVMLTAMWTRWTSVPEIRINTNAGGVVGVAEPLKWANSWFLSAGAQYKFNEMFTGKIGVAYDQTPTQDDTRSPRLPGNDRTWISAGIDWNVAEWAQVGLSYTHVFVKDSPIMIGQTGNIPAAVGMLTGSYCSNVNIIGVQANFRF